MSITLGRRLRSRSPAGAAPASINDSLAGILLIVACTVVFAACDVSAKYLTQRLPVPEVLWMRFSAFAVLSLAWAAPAGRHALATRRPLSQVARGLLLIGCSFLFILSVRVMPIADATALNFTSPMFITVLSVPLLGEQVGFRRWMAVSAGLVGVLMVAQPGRGTFQIGAVYAVLSAVCWAFGMIITRLVAPTDSAEATVVWSGVVGGLAASVAVPFVWISPSVAEVALGLFMGATFAAAHILSALAYRCAPASVVAPFSYLQILNSTLVGYFVFGAVPDALTVAGAGVVVLSGLAIARAEQRAGGRHAAR